MFIEYLIISIMLVILSLAMLGLSLLGWYAGRKIFRVPILVDLIFFFVTVKICLYYLLPTLLRIASDYKFVRDDGVFVPNLVYIYCIEFISWSIWMIALLTILVTLNKARRKTAVRYFINFNLNDSKIILVILSIGFIYGRLVGLFDFELPIFFEPFKALVFYAGLGAGPLLMLLSNKLRSKAYLVLGAFTTVFSVFSISTRGALVYLALFCLFLTFFVTKNRLSWVVAFSIFVVMSVSYFLFGGLLSGQIYLNETGQVSVDAGINVNKKGHRSSFEEVEWRFGAATRMGTAFLDLYDRGEAAGFNPIKNSLFGVLPRSIDPDKPIPNTLQPDDLYSQGMYIIFREIHGYNTYSMVEFPTGAHFYWEFGVLGILILSAISGIYIALCAHYFAKLGIVSVPLLLATFKPWGYVDPKIWVSDIAMQLYQIVIPIIVIVCFVRSVRFGLKVAKIVLLHAASSTALNKG